MASSIIAVNGGSSASTRVIGRVAGASVATESSA